MTSDENANRKDTGTPATPGAQAEQATTTVDEAQADLAEQLAQAKAQAAEYLDSWRRSTAELSNARKRMQREQAEFAATASARVLEKLLPIIDDMERAFKTLPADEAEPEWVSGFRMIQRKLQNLLQAEGVVEIPTTGQKFDPALHHALSHEEQEGYAEGEIIDEVARGYKLGDRVLRPSMVRVAKG